MLNLIKIMHNCRFSHVLAIALMITGAVFVPSARPQSQEIMRIAAVVNEDIISILDLRNRINIVISRSNLKDSTQLRRQIAPQILRVLIDERLQMQEAARLDINITDADVTSAIKQIEINRKLNKGGFKDIISKNKLDYDSVITQLRAELAWSRVISRKLRSKISVGEDEIDETLSRLESSRGQPENRIAEIFLSIETPTQESETIKIAENLLDQLKNGAEFSGIARQFSESATSAVGGDIGWVVAGELPINIESALEEMSKNQISQVIRTFDGVHIIKLLDRRYILTADPLKTQLHLAQFVIADRKDRQKLLSAYSKAKLEVPGCENMINLTRNIVLPQSGSLGSIKLGDLPADLRAAVNRLAANEISTLLDFGDNYRILMVCSRKEEVISLPSRDSLRQDIGNRRLELQARRYLRDLRRAAFIDIRV